MGANLFQLTEQQLSLIHSPSGNTVFLEGSAGAGKTTVGVNRLRHWLETGVNADKILVLVPQRTLGAPYNHLLTQSDLPAGGSVGVFTLGGIAQHCIELFFPLIAKQAGFSNPRHPPTFLTLETAQYYLSRIVKPLIQQGYFETVSLEHTRLLSQIIDNLNKAATIPFPHTNFSERLKSAWIGEPAQQRVYDDAQDCANRFRQFCLQNNLLDYSLQMEVFFQHIWRSFICRNYLFAKYRYIIFDNVEEDVPVTHDIIREWLPNLQSALLIYDLKGGFRSFLGADPLSGYSLKDCCHSSSQLMENWVTNPHLVILRNALSARLYRQEIADTPIPKDTFEIAYHRFYPQMVSWAVEKTSSLLKQGVPPGEIVILAPFVSDSLRFSLLQAFNNSGIPAFSHRPSRSLREEPVTNGLIALAKLAHPQWSFSCTSAEIRSAFFQILGDIDLVRADLLTRIVFSPNKQEILGSFDVIRSDMQQRVTFTVGERYERLRAWLDDYKSSKLNDLDIFLSRLFGEVISQQGFGFHNNYEAASVTAQLIESVQKFRLVTKESLDKENLHLGREYIQMVQDGVIAAQYLQQWENLSQDAVLIAPAYTFLMSNRSAQVQFWLDIGNQGWWERLFQPLTHPYVLSRNWKQDTIWTDAHELEINLQVLDRLLNGLILRCGSKLFLSTADINEQGNEQRGPLLQAIQGILRRLKTIEVTDV
jgi:hypothetical protein